MVGPCIACGRTLELGRFCPACGAEQREVRPPTDPLIGRVISERYEIIDLINVGGMGGVYRARHRALDRTVAIKFVHPHLLTAEDVATRFMIEAQTASRLNHPNVVSIFDFGRTPLDDGGRLFLVMEYLSGPDLATVMHREGQLAMPRICRILTQTLAALGEAHQLGIVHRDVKPENIILEPRRTGEHVKVIDFGIAKPEAGRRVTEEGRVMGTPVYMAPEQTTAEYAGPGVDLYAVGVMLFQLLAGRLPFDGPSPEIIMAQQRTARRPDPREIAPDRRIPAPIAELCLRSIDIDPAHRFASAEAFIEALDHAIGGAIAASLPVGVTPPQGKRRDTLRTAMIPAPGVPLAPAEGASISWYGPHSGAPLELVRTSSRGRRLWPVVGRDDELAWARALLGGRDASGPMALWGREGVGRTRLLEEIAAIAGGTGATVLRIAAFRSPHGEVSYSGLREIVALLARPSPGDSALGAGGGGGSDLEREGMRTIFADKLMAPRGLPDDAQIAATSALRWAARRAVASASRRRVVLAIDDVDMLDHVSQSAIADLAATAPIAGLTLLATSLRAPERWALDPSRTREIAGLSLHDAHLLLGEDESFSALEGAIDDVEPLYLEELARCRFAQIERPPTTLAELVEWRLRGLAPAELRMLETIATLGRTSLEELAAIASHAEDLADVVPALIELGFLTAAEDEGSVEIAHGAFARAAIAMAPRGAIAEVHARAADVLAGSTALIELCAHHAIRGQPDLGAFLLVEECARLRTMHGDDDGAIAMLWEGLQAAHTQALLGETDATHAWIAFGKKLGAALLDAEREDEAMGVLSEVLDQAGPRDMERAHVLALLADIAAHRKRLVEADSRRTEALAIAERMGDVELADHLRRSMTPLARERMESDGPPRSDDARTPPRQSHVQVSRDAAEGVTRDRGTAGGRGE